MKWGRETGLVEKGTWGKPRDEGVTWLCGGRAFQAEGRASTEALRWECASLRSGVATAKWVQSEQLVE